MSFPSHVKIVEVGPRDGLQNESTTLSVETRIELIKKLAETGLKNIEAGSFVSPKWIPQMADTDKVLQGLQSQPENNYPVLVPNLKGLEAAISAGASEIAIFATASETFSQKNINCSIAESLKRYKEVCKQAFQHQLRIRGYVSCVLGCPYEGVIQPQAVLNVAEALYQMGCYEISLGDTIGVGTAFHAQNLIQVISNQIPVDHLAVHFHDTYGQALANIFAVLELGIATVDSSVAGLGGCPYARGASGNVATEDVIYMFDGLGIQTGVDLDHLIDVGYFICQKLNKIPQSKVALARGH